MIKEQNKTTLSPTKRTVTQDGTILITWDNKLHNWEGPALIPEGNEKKGRYFIHGIEYSKKEWKERKKQGTGLPWYKSPGTKSRT